MKYTLISQGETWIGEIITLREKTLLTATWSEEGIWKKTSRSYLDAMQANQVFLARVDELLRQGYTLQKKEASFPVQAAISLLAGRYRILRELGRGGFGAVYLAEDTQREDNKVAIKEVRGDSFATKEEQQLALSSFNQEMELLCSLSHPRLPKIYNFWTTEQASYLVMSFIEGETLEKKVLSGWEASIPEVLVLLKSLCEVLSYLHTQTPPIIFRDLKPANIMIRPDGSSMLIDFGIARFFKAGKKKDTQAMGSPGYCPPEQYGKAQTTPQSDLYSLGATLYFLLTKDDPADHPFQFAELPKQVPAYLQTLLGELVALDSKKRPKSARIVLERLQPEAPPRKKLLKHAIFFSPLVTAYETTGEEERAYYSQLSADLATYGLPQGVSLVDRISQHCSEEEREQKIRHLFEMGTLLLLPVKKDFFHSPWGIWCFEMAEYYRTHAPEKTILLLLLEYPGISWHRSAFRDTPSCIPADFVYSEQSAERYQQLFLDLKARLKNK